MRRNCSFFSEKFGEMSIIKTKSTRFPVYDATVTVDDFFDIFQTEIHPTTPKKK